jgi:DNA-binding transcriptional LysR family regulator
METPYLYFEQIVLQGSIRQAAEHLNVSPSSISRQIFRLEREFGMPLLARHPRGVKLTPAGEILSRFVHNRSREFLRLRGMMDELKSLERGHVSIRTVEGMLGGGFLPRAVAAFARRHPGLTYEITVAGTDGVMRAVAEDRCDIGIAFQPQSCAGTEVVADQLQPVLAVVEPGHPFAQRASLRLADLAGVPIGLPDKSFGIRQIVDTTVLAGDIALSVRLETNSIDMVRQYALHGMGVSFLPRFSFEREADAGMLIGIPIDEPLFASARALICRNPDLVPTWAARAFIDVLTDPGARGFVLR